MALVRDVQNDTRRVKCWGMNSSGQLGIGTADLDPHPTATYVLDAAGQPLENVTSVSAKGWHVCAVVAGGVQCWGLLLNPNLSARVSPVPISMIPPGSGITYVEVGPHNTCAIQIGGTRILLGQHAPACVVICRCGLRNCPQTSPNSPSAAMLLAPCAPPAVSSAGAWAITNRSLACWASMRRRRRRCLFPLPAFHQCRRHLARRIPRLCTA